jgi:hypothetical protein
MAFTARAALLTALIGLFPAFALAQASAPTDTAGQPAGTSPDTPPDTAAPSASASTAPVFPATGYGWSTTPRKAGHGTRTHLRAARGTRAPDAILPGFETLGDGATRLFVQLSRPVEYVAKPAPGTLTFVLKGAHVDRRNNYNPLVTVDFNTPVSSARLAPHGGDLWFVVDLRANVTPSVTMEATKDGGAMLRIEFAKGDYLPAAAASAVSPPAPLSTPAPAPSQAPGASTPPLAH